MLGNWSADVKVLRAYYGRGGGQIPQMEVLADIWEDLCIEDGLTPLNSAAERVGE